jgi:mono/diheme cytochrome c family protein
MLGSAPLWAGQRDEASDLHSIVKRAQAYRQTYNGWRALRQLDCVRCHGADYHGTVGPSLIDSVRARSCADFSRPILEGNRERGMPPYKSVAGVADSVEGIYDYLHGLADGSIRPGPLAGPE